MARIFRGFIYFLVFLVALLAISYGVAQLYKPKILEAINRELQNGVNGEFQIGGLDFTIFEEFPNFSITLSDIYLRGPKYQQYGKDFFSAKKIFVHINPLHLVSGVVDLNSIAVREGDIFIFRAKDGYTNTDVFKTHPQNESTDTLKKESPLSLNLTSILLKNTRLTFLDSLRKKSFDITFQETAASVSTSDSSRSILLNGNMFFGGLTFNQARGGYLTNTEVMASLNLEFRHLSNKMVVHPSSLNFPDWHIDLSGTFDFNSPGAYNLMIRSDQLIYDKALATVTQSLQEKLSKYHFVNPLGLKVAVNGTLAPGDQPRVDIDFVTRNNRFETGKFAMDIAEFKGSFSNHRVEGRPYDDFNSVIRLDSISAKLHNLPFEARMTLTDLTDPNLDINLVSNTKLTELNDHSDQARLKFTGGISKLTFNFQGKLKEYLDTTRTSNNGKLTGTLVLADASVTMISQQKKFEKIDARLHFTEKRIDLDEVNLKLNGSALRLKGTVIGFMPFFLHPEKKGYVNLSVYSPRLNLASLSKKDAKAVSASKGAAKKKISDLIDVLDEKLEFNLDIKADELVGGNFKATEFRGKVSLKDDQFTANPIRMKLADGLVSVQFRLTDLDKKNNPMYMFAEVSKADIGKFFKSFNNFSQSTIKSENLSGTVSAEIRLKAVVDDKFNLLVPTMDGEVDFKVKDGRLLDFEPLQKMSNFLLKKRDFANVNFAEIDCQFKLAGQSLDISRMEIESTVLSLFIEGRYSLGDGTDLSIQVPLSNLRKRDKNYRPENVGVDAKVGPSIFLRAYQKDGKVVIAYVPFKKFKKSRN